MPTTDRANTGEYQYHRPMNVPMPNGETLTVWVDVYDVLEAFKRDGDGNLRQCLPGDDAVAHAIKKALCAGERGSKSRLQDLTEAIACIQRAINATINSQS